MSNITDPYQILGVSPNATDDEVKKATQRTIKRLVIGVLLFFFNLKYVLLLYA